MREGGTENPRAEARIEELSLGFKARLDKKYAAMLADEIVRLKDKENLDEIESELLIRRLGELERMHGPDASREGSGEIYSERFKARVVAFSEELLAERTDPGRVALGLAGIDTDEAWALRGISGARKANIGSMALSVIGIESDRAWDIRTEAIREASKRTSRVIWDSPEKTTFARSLNGLDSKEAWQWREELYKQKPTLAIESLGGLDSERAWVMRNSVKWPWVTDSLLGIESIEAWKIRDALSQNQKNGELANSLFGLDSERAWQERERLLQINAELIDKAIAKGLAGLDSDRAWDMRMRLYNKGKLDHEIAVSLAGLDSDRAWDMREKMLSNGMGRRMVARSMSDWRLVVVRKAAQLNKAK